MKLELFSSNRAAKEFLLLRKFEKPPCVLTLGEFFEKAVLVRELAKVSETRRILLMQQAASEVKALHEKLKIPLEFFAFLQCSGYLFALRKELLSEKKTVEDLDFGDTYAEFCEHLQILGELFTRYDAKLLEGGFFDEIASSWELNAVFLEQFDEICVNLDGFLSGFEMEILQLLAKKLTVKIRVKKSKFNHAIVSKLTTHELENGFFYELNLSDDTFCPLFSLPICADVKVAEFSRRGLQVAFVFDEVSKMIRAGIAPSRIAVITPDENFAQILLTADKASPNGRMLNFAMGTPFRTSANFATLSALQTLLDAGECYEFDEKYLTKSETLNAELCVLNFAKFPTQAYELAKQIWHKRVSYEEFKAALFECCKEIRIHEKIFAFRELCQTGELTFGELFSLLLGDLASQKIDDVGGGEVSVIGFLESRGVVYDGVVIVDFDDKFVPSRNDKEMFLNSSVRKNSGLISHQMRENLQLSYILNLINSAKMVRISHSSETGILSRFAQNLNFTSVSVDENAYQKALSTKNTRQINFQKEKAIKKHDFFYKPLSFSRFSCFDACEMRYFYHYVLGLNDERLFESQDDSSALGNAAHKAFECYFLSNLEKTKFDVREFGEIFKKVAKEHEEFISPLEKECFLLGASEIGAVFDELFEQGYRVKMVEKRFGDEFEKVECNGVLLEGKLDLVLENALGELFVLDFKTGKKESADARQLEFYEALLGGECEKKAFFHVFKGQIGLNEPKEKRNAVPLVETLSELKERNKKDVWEFERNEKACANCGFTKFCRKELR